MLLMHRPGTGKVNIEAAAAESVLMEGHANVHRHTGTVKLRTEAKQGSR